VDLVQLRAITQATAVSALTAPQLTELQVALTRLGYAAGDADGVFGPRTAAAWAQFKTSVAKSDATLIGPDSVAALQTKVAAPQDDFSTKNGTIAAIKRECAAQGIGLAAQVAYVLATTQWETAQTFQPVREAYWLSEQWRRQNLAYYPYYGRGYVQLTWRANYDKYGALMALDLAGEPDLALQPRTALFVLVHGFRTGSFTGRAITEFIDAGQTNFADARRCINGTDHAADIAAIAQQFLATL
jgi:predicted chitinase